MSEPGDEYRLPGKAWGHGTHYGTGLRIRFTRKLPGTRNHTEIGCRRDTTDALS